LTNKAVYDILPRFIKRYPILSGAKHRYGNGKSWIIEALAARAFTAPATSA
jgi:hypothetical protein